LIIDIRFVIVRGGGFHDNGVAFATPKEKQILHK